MITTAKPERRPRSQNMREIANVVFYIVKVGKQWRLLPHDLLKWQTVCYYFRPWESDGTWKKIHGFLRAEVRVRAERKVESSAAMVDAPSVKTAANAQEVRFDGSKRHPVVNTLRLLLSVFVHSAQRSEQAGFKLLLQWFADFWPRLQLLWVDSSYRPAAFIEWVQQTTGLLLQPVKRPEGQKGFEVIPQRLVIERTFSWFNHYRRLSKDYELLPTTSETMIHVAMTHLMQRSLTRRQQVAWNGLDFSNAFLNCL